jgi:hypothetical protein
MKKAIVITVLVMVIAVPLTVLVGCGGGNKSDTGSASTSDVEQTAENVLRMYYQGDAQGFINMLPPDMRDQYGEMFTSDMPQGGDVVEANFRTEMTDATHALVYFWGTLQFDVNGQPQTESITEAEAQPVPFVYQDGQWYIDIATMFAQAQQQVQQQSSGTTQTP